MSEMRATTCLPARLPSRTIASASVSAFSMLFINAPLPVFTSSTIASAPAASFLLMIELTISGMDSMVPVTSRSAYSLRSAGASSALWPVSTIPISWICALNSVSLRSVR